MRPIFFDLDHTLWDFETNSRNTLSELLVKFEKEISLPLNIEAFFPVYAQQNEICWDLYRKHEITQTELRIRRFKEAFATFKIPFQNWVFDFAELYTSECPRKGALMPGARETLQNISQRYNIYIITNGFEEVQKVKLQYSGLGEFISGMITSEAAGFRKPDLRIFQYALQHAGKQHHSTWYIGDDYETDVRGGHAAGLISVFFNPDKKENPDNFPEISQLTDLLSLLEG